MKIFLGVVLIVLCVICLVYTVYNIRFMLTHKRKPKQNKNRR